ncbi:uncharacterized protein MELLADRAFT_103376 [Melampsora larici-populina 98AG31]|uniref:Uncharacterized protein n=1 Tax=Melampsora larici-populina (strain 98AG31 / pathotype 3-4-7) TaxID=747676 RepID=F4RB96_MELLP|nr:uncharacterized protein MELLADRAFT_103376 [Melampsora larici-populina 98AG31]EGG10397.1 hypothetical protein MELLADRAFT_103376 [Melampsora larici-populina 98AG31]
MWSLMVMNRTVKSFAKAASRQLHGKLFLNYTIIMFQSTRVVNLYSKADLNALLGNSSGDWTAHLPPPSLERRVPSTKPICLTEDASKFHLDMSFNRDGPQRDHHHRFTDSIGPKTLPGLVEGPGLITSDIPEDANRSEWRRYLGKWTFPLRTDPPRGLTWGPYYDPREVSLKRLAEENSDSQVPKRRRIITILRLPEVQPRILIKLKINKNLLRKKSIKKENQIHQIQDQEILVKSTLAGSRKRDLSSQSSFLIDELLQTQSKPRHCDSNLNNTIIENSNGKRNSQGGLTTSHQLLNGLETNKYGGGALSAHSKELVDLLISPSKDMKLIKPRIRICVARQLKYGL